MKTTSQLEWNNIASNWTNSNKYCNNIIVSSTFFQANQLVNNPMSANRTLRGSSEYIHHVPKRQLNRIDRLYAVAIQVWINTITYLHWKVNTLAGIWTRDLTSTRPICYQLSYLGLDGTILSVIERTCFVTVKICDNIIVSSTFFPANQ